MSDAKLAATPPKPARSTDLVEAVVARGTVYYDHPDTEPVEDPGRKIGWRAGEPTLAGPGETVLLPAAEVARLRKMGVLTDPTGNGPVIGTGPKMISEEEGAPTVQGL